MLKEIARYQVILEADVGHSIFTAKDGATVGSVIAVGDLPGKLILLPHFDFLEYDDADREVWSVKAVQLSKRIASHIVVIDSFLQQKGAQTPPPEWLTSIDKPQTISRIDRSVADIDARVDVLQQER